MKSTFPRNVLPGIGIDGEQRGSSDSYASQVVLKDLRKHPNGGKVRDGVEPRVRLNVQVRERISFGDVAGHRRVDLQCLTDLTGGFEPRNLPFGDVPLLEALPRSIEQGCDAGGDARNSALRKVLCVLLREQVFALGDDQFRAMDREQPLTFPHVLVGRVRKYLLDVAGDSRLNVGQPCFVDGDVAGGPDFILHRFPLDQSELHADGLQSFGGELDGREWSFRRWRSRTGRTALGLVASSTLGAEPAGCASCQTVSPSTRFRPARR